MTVQSRHIDNNTYERYQALHFIFSASSNALHDNFKTIRIKKEVKVQE